MRRFQFHAAARRELREATAYYDEEADLLGDDFASEVQEAVRLAWEHPGIGQPYLAATRRILVPRFPYSIVYRTTPELLFVLAVPHHRRKPGYWLDRV